MLCSLNEETAHKLIEEKEKFNTLRSEHIDLQERLFLKAKQITEDTNYNKETEVQIAKLKQEIDQVEKEVNLKSEQKADEDKIFLEETKKNRSLCQKKSALVAKMQFIEDHYDYSTNVKDIPIELFRTI
jgi:hypothetical protein